MPRNYAEHNSIDFQKSFPNDDSCAKHLAEQRWPEGLVCPICDHKGSWFLAKRRLNTILSPQDTVYPIQTESIARILAKRGFPSILSARASPAKRICEFLHSHDHPLDNVVEFHPALAENPTTRVQLGTNGYLASICKKGSENDTQYIVVCRNAEIRLKRCDYERTVKSK